MSLKDALNRTQAKQVHVSYSQVAELIGEALTEDLCLSTTAMSQKRTKERNLVKAMMSAGKTATANLGTFPREQLLEAIKDAETPKKSFIKKVDE
jgi:hypothetical protein